MYTSIVLGLKSMKDAHRLTIELHTTNTTRYVVKQVFHRRDVNINSIRIKIFSSHLFLTFVLSLPPPPHESRSSCVSPLSNHISSTRTKQSCHPPPPKMAKTLVFPFSNPNQWEQNLSPPPLALSCPITCRLGLIKLDYTNLCTKRLLLLNRLG